MVIPLAVNGTLMRGLELNGNLLAAGATFVRETATVPETLGVLGEPALCEDEREITRWGGWRAYTADRHGGRA